MNAKLLSLSTLLLFVPTLLTVTTRPASAGERTIRECHFERYHERLVKVCNIRTVYFDGPRRYPPDYSSYYNRYSPDDSSYYDPYRRF